MTHLFSEQDEKVYQKICQLSQHGILRLMSKLLRPHYKQLFYTQDYLVAIGDIPVGLVAHADTVFARPPSSFFYDRQKNVYWSPEGMGADDRAGVFAILKIIKSGLRPHIIITTDEEIGCVGADKLAMNMPIFPAELKFLIQLDRQGHDDSVYYSCANADFEAFINSYGFKTQQGSFSDIAVLAPQWSVAAVNLSVGYFLEHTKTEHLYVGDLFETIVKVKRILWKVKKDPVPVYPYIEEFEDSWWTNLESESESGSRCDGCGEPHPVDDLAFICYTKDDSKVHIMKMCDECYARISTGVKICPKCGKSWISWSKEKDWRCPDCQNK